MKTIASPYNDDRVIPIDRFLRELDRKLSDIAWNGNDEEEERRLRNSYASVKVLLEQGDEFVVLF